jgi:prevent-host-death family protein
MSRMDSSEVRKNLAKTLDRVQHKGRRIVIERHGTPAAALVPVKDLRLLKKVLKKLEDLDDVRAARAALEEEGEIPWEQVKKGLGL